MSERPTCVNCSSLLNNEEAESEAQLCSGCASLLFVLTRKNLATPKPDRFAIPTEAWFCRSCGATEIHRPTMHAYRRRYAELEGTITCFKCASAQIVILKPMESETYVDPHYQEGSVKRDVIDCPRCRGNHEKLIFNPLKREPIAEYTHWAMCPASHQPVMLTVKEEEAPDLGILEALEE